MIELIAQLAVPPNVNPTLSGAVPENREIKVTDIRVRLVIEFMESNLERRMAVAELARIVDLSDSRFRHLFTAQAGVSPKAYLRKLRLDRAKVLLDEGALTIDQIALRVGWQHRSHFERRFKQLYSMTPAQYRMMRRINLVQKRMAAAASAIS